jgi:hypothetical protein
MAAQPVEWVLVVHYGPEAHRATYGRQVKSNRYTKDYIQLSRREEFLASVTKLFSAEEGGSISVPLTYRWPSGTSTGAFVFKSADRPHLKWETSSGAPQVWKMTPAPSDATPETIPGDPAQLDFDSAEKEFELLASRGAGQPYLMAVKLRDEARTLHLRVYLKDPSEAYTWADLSTVPLEIQHLAGRTSQRSAIAWSLFSSAGALPDSIVESVLSRLGESVDQNAVLDTLDLETGRGLSSYLRAPGHGLFFDPVKNHNAWSQPAPLSAQVASSLGELLEKLEARFPALPQGDAVAERLEADPTEVAEFSEQILHRNYGVADATATVKTRGSAQRAFAGAVKSNYGYRCAITGISTRDFLVAAHIVPWSEDHSIRLDPSNGICLSLLVDRAFENGHLVIEDDLTVRIDWDRVGSDEALKIQLAPYDGKKASTPTRGAPEPAFLRRRRTLVIDPDPTA